MCADMASSIIFSNAFSFSSGTPLPVEPGGTAITHGDPVAPILVALMLIALGAMVGGRLMQRIRQPAVLGELLVGVLVANIAYYFHRPTITILREGGSILTLVQVALTHNVSLAEAANQLFPATEHTRRVVEALSSPAGPIAVSVYQFVDLLSRIGVIVLLFLVGLETSVREMAKVGISALSVAVVGVVCPFLLGLGAMALLLPQNSHRNDLFIGAILTATSVAITARVFGDLGQTKRVEAKIILGAAVIDDVLALLLLAVVSVIVVTGTFSAAGLVMIGLKAISFIAGSIGVGLWITPHFVKRAARWKVKNFELLFGLGFAFVLSWLANWIGLATIVGAFAAGLLLGDLFSEELSEGHSLRNLLSPVESLIVPIFFVLMGMQVKLETLANREALVIAAGLTAAAIIGKLAAGLACSRKVNRLVVGIGMMPRGEVGLIFVSVGKGLGIVTDAVFSAVVMMVMVTTILTPPLLKVALEFGGPQTNRKVTSD
jgi:Kef-type K+ transport system membrane component KefB